MTKEVMISVRGLQFETEHDAEEIEVIQKGEYYKKNETHYIIYEELMEGFDESTKNIIKFKDHEMNITKKGLMNVHMNFEEQKKHLTNYNTPFGNIVVGLEAKKVKIEEADKRIVLDVEYALDINYEYLADCKIKVDIRSTDGEAFLLQ
ncbi:MAG: DUF1934 domain-containing protein [Eubacteriales bacterium]